jgi:hypothetical protein
MSIISEISVGDVNYYVVDDFPDHTAPKGSVSIRKNNYSTRMYLNNDGGTTWLKTISPEYGEMFFNGNTTQRNTGQNAWSSLSDLTTTVGDLKGFNVSSNLLTYTGNTTIKVSTSISTTIRGGNTRWMDYELGISKNNITPSLYHGSTNIGNAEWVKINSNRFTEITNGNFFTGGIRWINRQSGGNANDRSYAPRHLNISVHKIDEADTIFVEDWETNSFSTNNWILVNSTTNVWVLGTAENNTNGGSYSAYISNDGGTTAAYTITTANISHMYKDFVIPNNNGDVVLSFDWKSWGENAAGVSQYDFGSVNMVDTGTTPTADVEVSTALVTLTNGIPSGNGRIGATTNSGKFNLGYGGADSNWRRESINLSNYKGQTKRIVFSWINDASVGNQPPFVIDNIKLDIY